MAPREPSLGEFKGMIRAGASNQDIHDRGNSDGYASSTGVADDLYIQREVDRVALHQQALTPLLERYIGRAPRILDFGCGTGGSTVAMSLSGLGADQVVGVDANPSAVAAARVRANGYELAPPQVTFMHVEAGAALPYPDGWFDLVVAVSVLEFITAAADRDAVVAELRRLVVSGGFLYIATPRPRLREYHSGALLGDVRRVAGMPWASPPWQVRAWGDGWLRVNLSEHFASRVTRRLPWLPAGALSMVLGPVLPLAGAWQKALFRRLGA